MKDAIVIMTSSKCRKLSASSSDPTFTAVPGISTPNSDHLSIASAHSSICGSLRTVTVDGSVPSVESEDRKV